MNKILSLLKNNKGFVLILLLILVVRGSIADYHPVPTGSMKPTILEGDWIWENKMAYDLQLPFSETSLMRISEPKRGDIIVFTSEIAKTRLIKRLVGLPGETIEVRNNQIFINDQAAQYTNLRDENLEPIRDEDKEQGVYALEQFSDTDKHIVHVKPQLQNPYKYFGKVTIPENHYFFMGDNRDNSNDSRANIRFVPRSELRGRASNVFLSFNKHKSYKPRFERFTKPLKFSP